MKYSTYLLDTLFSLSDKINFENRLNFLYSLKQCTYTYAHLYAPQSGNINNKNIK